MPMPVDCPPPEMNDIEYVWCIEKRIGSKSREKRSSPCPDIASIVEDGLSSEPMPVPGRNCARATPASWTRKQTIRSLFILIEFSLIERVFWGKKFQKNVNVRTFHLHENTGLRFVFLQHAG